MNKKTELTREDIVDLLYSLGASKVRNNETNDNIQFTCTVHGENNPSAGVSIEKQQFNCFSCHEHGSLPWLVYKSLPDDFNSVQEAKEYLSDRYGVEYSPIDRRILKGLRRYEDYGEEDEEEQRFELDRFELAPFKSGKETYQYFFDRGFTKQTLKEYQIGRDLTNETVTVPIFWEDNVLAGIIGRYIDPNRPHNQRYKIYCNCPTGDFLYPLHKLEVTNNTIILVEGLLDGLWLHQLGIHNALALLTNNISDKQMDIVKKYATTVIDFTDNDDMGNIATRIIKQKCKDEGIRYLSVKDNYPKGTKDPQDLDKEQILNMLKKARGSVRKPLRKIED